MAVNYAQPYVDRACESRDLFTLYDMVCTLDVERDLAEPFKFFVRLWEWYCSTRSGVWQYYESISLAEFQNTAEVMDRCKLGEIATRYRAGMEDWEGPDYCGDLDKWIDDHWETIESAAMALIESDRQCLFPAPNRLADHCDPNANACGTTDVPRPQAARDFNPRCSPRPGEWRPSPI